MNWFKLCAIIVTAIFFSLGESSARSLSARDISKVDSSYTTGMAYLETREHENAERWFRAALAINPKHAPSYVGSGHVHLKMGNLKEAEKAFRQALRKRKNYAPALNGLGMVFRDTDKMRDWAIKYFRSAYQADRGYVEAYYNLAQTYGEIGDTKELDTYKKLVKVDPDHSDAWFQIGRIYKSRGVGRVQNSQKAEAAYRRQLNINRHHLGAKFQLAQVLKESGRTDEALVMLKAVVDTPNAHQRRAFLELTEVYQRARDHDVSEVLLDAFLEGLAPDEQAVYYDLSLVAIGDELTGFEATPDEERIALSEAFWAGRDPATVTAANERWIEHCRRVAYARENFGKFGFPWDARGEVYVRFGEPDHISRSDDIRFETEAGILEVKEKLVNGAGVGIVGLMRSRDVQLHEYDLNLRKGDASVVNLGPISSILRELSETGKYRTTDFAEEGKRKGTMGVGVSLSSDTAMMSATVLGWPVYPVTGKVWEYWIYANVGAGIEITFTQPFFPGPFGYADMPLGIGGDSDVVRNWQQMNPQVVIERVTASTPSTYSQDFATEPMEFFFASAQFKGPDGSTDIEIYYGVPVAEMNFLESRSGDPTAYLKRGVALVDREFGQVYRSVEEMAYFLKGFLDTTKIAFVPELDRLSLSPGTYQMSVQIRDESSHKSQVYRQQVTLSSYEGEDLQLSGIQMAASIRQNTGGKFAKRGLEVVPNPSLAYLPGQPVFVFYEVYNLKRDEFGATKYRVSYEISSMEGGNLAVRILSALGRMVGNKEKAQAVVVEYAHVGNQADDYVYLELDMSNTEPGMQLLKVTVMDDNTGQTSASTATFTIR